MTTRGRKEKRRRIVEEVKPIVRKTSFEKLVT
jgi:hypothetical protein